MSFKLRCFFMGPQYHLMVGSFAANLKDYSLRERRFIMLAALAPDLDGIFFFNANLWERMHHTFSHNIYFTALVSAILALASSKRRIELFAVCYITALLQLLLDLVSNHCSWKQKLLWPLWDFDFSLCNFIEWEHMAFTQVWVVQGTLMVAILIGVVYMYKRTGRTFIELVSVRLDRFVTDFITLPFTKKCAVCGRRPYYRSENGEPLCPLHADLKKDLTVKTKVNEEDNTE